MNIGRDAGGATVNVTAINGNTVTVTRGVNGSTAKVHAVGDNADVIGDFGGAGLGQTNLTIGGTKYNLATVVLPHQVDVEGAAHETGHGHGYDHSRALSRSESDYKDATDIMSAYDGTTDFSANQASNNYVPNSGTDFGGSGLYNTVLGEQEGSKGPGLEAINLDKMGWIPASREASFSGSQITTTLHSLGDPTALGAPPGQLLEARVPAVVTIQNASPKDANGNPIPATVPPTCAGAGFGCTTSQYYTFEYREKAGFDRGQPADAVVVHLLGNDARSYWLNQTPAAAPVGHGGRLNLGDEYVDSPRSVYATVNAIDSANHTATVTISNAKITTATSLSGPTSGDFNDDVTLAADVKVKPSNLPVPNMDVRLTVGSQSCIATTDAAGHAACPVTIDQHPGVVSLGASFAGDDAYGGSTATGSFTLTPEESKVTYTGATTSDYHDATRVSATLTDPDGGAPLPDKPITFRLGVGDTCTATTDFAGGTACDITPTQAAGTYPITASFGPDVDYLSSTASTFFTITKEQTTLTYDGPTHVANDFPTTLSGTLLEDGVTPIQGRKVTFTLGSGASAQSCDGPTDAAGHAGCTIPSVTQPASVTSVPVRADFASDPYYLASSASATVKLVYYTGRAYALAQKLPLLPQSFTSDTGSISTASRSNTTRSAAIVGTPPAGSFLEALLSPLFGPALGSILGSPVRVSALNASVDTGGGQSLAQASAGDVTIGVPFLPVVHASAVKASSLSTCDVHSFTAGETGASTIGTLTIGGVPMVTTGLGPNATIHLGPATIVLNEQLPVDGASSGLQVNAIHITVAGVTDIVVASAQSDMHNCP